MTVTVLPQPDRPPHRPKHRWLAAIVVVLLIAVPAGYLVLSAFQSRESGRDKQRDAAAPGLVWRWPSKVERRIYEVPVPPGASYVAHYETNSWERSSFYVQFRTSRERLHAFMREVGSHPSALREGREGVGDRQADVVGWDLDVPGHRYAGARVERPGERPDLAITVDVTREERLRVYVVSTAEF
ncbi:MAG TPA: hypothetical protein VE546_17465 [Streptomyces sp.]|uniref:hypothetical protein n=1 Tax=Streptomyces sp. TaxID=1931 RepID=UPI002D2FF093|nr:hypothetical protein [Streptomyces sp.]HZG05331.1 hypothetical protein [Streptomyces sp.]